MASSVVGEKRVSRCLGRASVTTAKPFVCLVQFYRTTCGPYGRPSCSALGRGNAILIQVIGGMVEPRIEHSSRLRFRPYLSSAGREVEWWLVGDRRECRVSSLRCAVGRLAELGRVLQGELPLLISPQGRGGRSAGYRGRSDTQSTCEVLSGIRTNHLAKGVQPRLGLGSSRLSSWV